MALASDKLVTLGAGPGMRDWQTDWSARDYVTSAKCVEIAMWIAAVSQGRPHAEDAGLSPSQLSAIHSIWNRLYFTGLLGAGPANDPMLVARVTEIRDKLASATAVARLLKDRMRIALSLQATAWYQAKIGETQKAEEFRRGSGTNLKWPPIWSERGKVRVLMAEDTTAAENVFSEIQAADAAVRTELRKDGMDGTVTSDYHSADATSEEAAHKDFFEKFYGLYKRADRRGMVALCWQRMDDAKFMLMATTRMIDYYNSLPDSSMHAIQIGGDTVRPAALRDLIENLTQSIDEAQKGHNNQ
jgi:hypothetical protein